MSQTDADTHPRAGQADLSGHAPMSGLDELPIHQANAPLRLTHTTDPRAFERYWFSVFDEEGGFFLVAGVGVYPNVGTVDAYGLIVVDGKQTTVRANRKLGLDRTDLSVGPLSFNMVEPFTEWRLRLDDNAHDFTFDLSWRDSKRAIFNRFGVDIPGVIDTRLAHDWCGYETFGRVSGTINHQGRTIEVSGAKTRGSRDHHWGTRDGVAGLEFYGTKPFKSHRGEPLAFSHFAQFVEFDDWSIWAETELFNIGDSEHPGAAEVKLLERNLHFDPETKHLTGGVVVNELANGERREVTYEALDGMCAYLRTAGYEGCNGLGTPDDNFTHGKPFPEGVYGETYDTSDPAVRMQLEGFEDRVVRATCNGETTVGLLECRNPAIYAMASKNIMYSVLS